MSEENNSKNLSKIEREELIAICERLRGNSSDPSTQADINRLITFIRSRKYGLMFERHEEEVDRLLKDHLPAFYDAEDKTIKTKDTDDCNFLLEGDNLHSLKLLEKTHKGKIDVIYIDPPYNTGNNDFIYADNMVGQDDGFRHSKWLSFMKERLEIARELLSDEGVIFISIDDHEQAQLKLLCDSIFGEDNYLNTIIWRYTTGGIPEKGRFSAKHDTIFVYAKNESKHYLMIPKEKSYSQTIPEPHTESGIRLGVKRDTKCEFCGNSPGAKYREVVMRDVWTDINSLFRNSPEKFLLKDLGASFDTQKPIMLIKRIIKCACKPDGIVLDFFAGSGTTGHTVLELNQEDGGDRHFILCTNNENNICENITYQRLKTVITGIRPDGTKYSDGIKANLKYFKTDMVAFDDEELEDKLITSSECLMQLENSSLLSSPDIDIAYCDEDLEEIFTNKPHLKTLYLLEDVLFNAEQAKYIESHNIEIKRIADCYYEGV